MKVCYGKRTITKVAIYGIFMHSKFSRLRMKRKWENMSTCTEPVCIYALLKITDNFFTHLWPDVSSYTLDFRLELKNLVWIVGVYLEYHEPPQEEITRGKIARSLILVAIPCRHPRISLVPEIFRGVMQEFHVRCGRSLDPAETRSCQSPILHVRPQLRRYLVSVPLSDSSSLTVVSSSVLKKNGRPVQT